MGVSVTDKALKIAMVRVLIPLLGFGKRLGELENRERFAVWGGEGHGDESAATTRKDVTNSCRAHQGNPWIRVGDSTQLFLG